MYFVSGYHNKIQSRSAHFQPQKLLRGKSHPTQIWRVNAHLGFRPPRRGFDAGDNKNSHWRGPCERSPLASLASAAWTSGPGNRIVDIRPAPYVSGPAPPVFTDRRVTRALGSGVGQFTVTNRRRGNTAPRRAITILDGARGGRCRWFGGGRLKRSWFFAFFFISGFCSLVYEVVWLRLSMAKFGVTTPMVSIVLSVFMAGLGLGSWAGGRFIRRFDASAAGVPLRFYGTLELLIGISGLAVPPILDAGYGLLRDAGRGLAWGSSLYYLASGAWIAVALLPWCTAMGATFPFAMAAIRKIARHESERAFSYLYLANLLGALLGTLVPAIALIELYGFRGTLHIAAALNVTLAAAVFLIGYTLPKTADSRDVSAARPDSAFHASRHGCGPCRVAVHHRPVQHGHGGGLDPPVHGLSGKRGVRVRGHSGAVSERQLHRVANLSSGGPDPRSEREPHGLDPHGAGCPVAVAAGRSAASVPGAGRFRPKFSIGHAPRRSGHRAIQRVSGVRDADAGGPRLPRQPRFRRPGICRERAGIDPRARAGRILHPALGGRAWELVRDRRAAVCGRLGESPPVRRAARAPF